MSKKKDDCMEEQPGWYNGQFLDEVGFCCDFICRHPMVCVGGKFFSKEGRIHDENGIKKQIYEMLRPFLKVGLAKKCSNLLEMLRMEAYKDNLPVHEDRLHVANGTLFVKGEFSENKEFCRNRLPVKYNPDAPQPVTWLHFLSELLEDEDILTLQEISRLLPYTHHKRTDHDASERQRRRGQEPYRCCDAGYARCQSQKRQHCQGRAQSLCKSRSGT